MGSLGVLKIFIVFLAIVIMNNFVKGEESIEANEKDEVPNLNKEKIEFCQNLVFEAIKNEKDQIKEIEEKYSNIGKMSIQMSIISRINRCYRLLTIKKLRKVFINQFLENANYKSNEEALKYIEIEYDKLSFDYNKLKFTEQEMEISAYIQKNLKHT